MTAKGVNKTGRSRFKPVLCPECGRGRLCDGNLNVQAFRPRDITGTEKRLEIKCPRCGRIAVITLNSA